MLSLKVKNLCTCMCCNFIVRTKAALKVHVKLEQNILDGSVSLGLGKREIFKAKLWGLPKGQHIIFHEDVVLNYCSLRE